MKGGPLAFGSLFVTIQDSLAVTSNNQTQLSSSQGSRREGAPGRGAMPQTG